jgi:hypothetical protein
VSRHKEVLTYKQYADMTYDELYRILKEKFRQAQRISLWFGELERLGVLVALTAMHDKVAQPGRRIPNPNQPNWEDVCRSLGITPNLVRVWRCRTQANTDIRHLLGEQPAKPGGRQADGNSQIRHHLAELCREVLYGEDEQAERIAMELVERYGF